MQVIIPMAGKGTRMRPHTFNKPRPLMQVAGQPVLGHIIERIEGLKPSKIHFIVNGYEEIIEGFLSKYNFDYSLTTQKTPSGDGGAILLAKNKVDMDDDLLVVFSDTISDSDLGVIDNAKKENKNIVWVKEVDDPRRFGVVLVKDGKITSIFEKPEIPPSNLAIIGMYYFSKAKKMFEYIEKIKAENIQSKGEYRLADALHLMITHGENLIIGKTERWLDCGTPEATLNANMELLNDKSKVIKTANSVIIEPVHISEGAIIKDSVIGPFVSIGEKTVIDSSIIRNSIIENSSSIIKAKIDSSLIGSKVNIEGAFKKINLADNSHLISKE